MLGLKRVHHIAIIATDYAKSKAFYCDILGFTLQSEFYREERDSWKGDLALNGEYVIELFSFPFPPARPSRPEACGLRHLAFSVDDIDAAVAHLEAHGVACEGVRIDPFTGKRFTFLTIRTACRWRFISSNSCQSVPCPVTCRARFPQLILS
jgi:glyoxylase I family protein